MYVKYEIALSSPDALLVFGGIFGVIAAIIVSSVLLLVSRAMRGAILYGCLLTFVGSSFIVSMVLDSGPALGEQLGTLIVIHLYWAAFFVFCLIVGALMLVNKLHWFYSLLLLHFVVGMCILSQTEQVIPVWITSFEVMFDLIAGLAAFFLLRPERRSIFDD